MALTKANNRMIDGAMVNVLDFGAVADGVDTGSSFTGTDSTAAFQAALDFASTNDKTLYIPEGNFYFAKQNLNDTGYLLCPNDKYVISGSGANTVLMIDEDPTWYDGTVGGRGVVFLFDTGTSTTGQKDEHDFFRIKDLTLKGRWSHVAGSRGLNGFRIEGFNDVQFDNIRLIDIRNNGTRSKHNNSYIVVNTYAERCAAGAWRSQDTNKVICTGNVIKHTDDDALDFHSADEFASSYPARTSIVISNNVLEGCEGIVALGAKHIVVSDNTLKLCHGSAIVVGSSIHPEGATSPFALTVSNNMIVDTIERYDNSTGGLGTSNTQQGVIYISGDQYSTASTSGVIPGKYDAVSGTVLPIWTNSGTTPKWGALNVGDTFDEGSDTTVYSSAGGFCYTVTGNVVMRTLPEVTNYSDWGFGPYYDGAYGFVDPAVNDNNFKAHGFVLLGEMSDFIISSNTVLGMPEAAVYFRGEHSSGRELAFRNGIISGNTFRAVKNGILKDNIGGSPAFADYDDWPIIISGNIFDIDPYHVSSLRTSPLDGSWVSDSGSDARAIYMRNCKGLIIENNLFKNTYAPVQGNVDPYEQFDLSKNTVACNPSAIGYTASNKGVADVPRSGEGFIYTIIFSDPTTANYDTVNNVCVNQATSVPTSGTYVTGHFVRNSNPTTASSKTVMGWARQTVGTGHAVATTTTADWAPLVIPTS